MALTRARGVCATAPAAMFLCAACNRIPRHICILVKEHFNTASSLSVPAQRVDRWCQARLTVDTADEA